MDQSVAFAIEGEAPPDRPPSTAEEYLQQVRWQANRIDDVIVAKDVETHLQMRPVFGMQGFSEIPPIPEGMKPSKEWEIDFLDEFKSQRSKWECKKKNRTSIEKLQKGPPPNDKKQWRQYCFVKENPPIPSVILSLDFVSLQKVSFLILLL